MSLDVVKRPFSHDKPPFGGGFFVAMKGYAAFGVQPITALTSRNSSKPYWPYSRP